MRSYTAAEAGLKTGGYWNAALKTGGYVLALALAATPAWGQQAPAPAVRLTLEEARTRALEASHRLAEARARETVAQAVIEARVAAERPSVSVSGGYTRTNHVTPFFVPGPTGLPRAIYPDVPDNYRSRLDLQWPIYTGGRTDALERAARAEAGAAAADVETARADLRLEVARAFWAVVTARAAVAVVEDALERAGVNVNDTRQRLNAGLVPPNEVASAEAQQARQRMLLVEAQNQRDVSLAELARLVGLDPSQAIEPVAELEQPPAAGQTFDALAREGLARRPDRKALELRITAADLQKAAAAAGRKPSIGVGAGVDYARPNPKIFPRADHWDDSWDAGVSVSWSLWDGGRVAADVAQAAGAASAVRARLREFDSVLAVEVRQRSLEISSGTAAVAAADEAVRAATEARRVVGERYRAGVIAQGDVLEAELQLLQSQLDRTRALASVRFAEARLDRVLGR
ncbi:MAG TPA: TolC family protein [Methylomirabilota bacterium]|nr:TolC family protein [Methylomirabilota bacterium]